MKFRKNIFLFFISFFTYMNLSAQTNNTGLSLDDLIPGGKTFNNYRVKMPRQLQWWGERLLYVDDNSNYIMIASFEKNKENQILISKEEINEGLSLNKKEELKNLNNISFPYPNSSIIQIRNKGEIYLYDFVEKNITATFSLPEKAQNIDFCREKNMIAYTKKNNLYLLTKEGKEQAITNDSNKGIVSGQAVHRNEFGIMKGTFWSPNGNYLAFYRMDETMVTDYPLVNVSARVAELKDIKYPMAGMESHHVTIGIYNPETQHITFLKTGTPKEKYLTNIAWSPDEKSIYVAEINRGQDTCQMNRYNVATGEFEMTLFEEIHPKYVEPEKPILFLKNNPQQFIWLSKRDGHNHAYLYDTSGKLLNQLTAGEWDIISITGFDEKGENLYYVSTEESPIEQHIYQLSLKNNKKVKLTKEQGIHYPLLSSSGKYICDSYSSQFNPGKVAITETKSNKTMLFHEAKNPYEGKTLPEITIGTIKGYDNKTDLYYRLVKPVDFDPNTKYPTIVYVYGGPHSQMVTNAWMASVRGWDIYMAQKGYVVFTMDNHGTSNRGAEFENVIHRQLGIIETQDQMKGVEYLTSLPYVDEKRIGVHGWSFGGFMTLNLMLRHPEVFKAGAAGGPVTDWKYYEIMYGERYMDSPQENPEGYAETNMLDKAGNLKGRLLLIHGDEDPTVVMQQNFLFIKSCIQKGTHPDFFVYPGQGHNMTGQDRIHLHEHITRYFEDFLK